MVSGRNVNLKNRSSEMSVSIPHSGLSFSFGTIYGGWNTYTAVTYGDAYVLSVPSFRWIKVNEKDDFEAQAINNVGRAAHQCAIYNDAQMIVLGGSAGAEIVADRSACNPAHAPIRVLDTSTYTWKRTFDPLVKYTVPEVVTNIIGGK